MRRSLSGLHWERDNVDEFYTEARTDYGSPIVPTRFVSLKKYTILFSPPLRAAAVLVFSNNSRHSKGEQLLRYKGFDKFADFPCNPQKFRCGNNVTAIDPSHPRVEIQERLPAGPWTLKE